MTHQQVKSPQKRDKKHRVNQIMPLKYKRSHFLCKARRSVLSKYVKADVEQKRYLMAQSFLI